ncbi:hypothetical protein PoB_003480200 [Plakobranchus ocellatus]|uniref:Uncharacterized protein n=1 Tax=Plakobranchus ocellatus TaxID=259542 RepID=A0AAV4AMV8_9GAST|nr:hypothetical protein PoB_003480200 [Plakobranchus ocellatus]
MPLRWRDGLPWVKEAQRGHGDKWEMGDQRGEYARRRRTLRILCCMARSLFADLKVYVNLWRSYGWRRVSELVLEDPCRLQSEVSNHCVTNHVPLRHGITYIDTCTHTHTFIK